MRAFQKYPHCKKVIRPPRTMSAPPTGPPPSAEFLAASKGPQVLAIIIIFPILALIAVTMRLYTRFRLVNSPSYEDFAIFLAMVKHLLNLTDSS